MGDRSPPPITLIVPGRAAVPDEVLAVGPAPQQRSLPLRLRALALTAAAVLVAGVVGAVQLESSPAPPLRLPVPTGVPGVTARAFVAAEAPLVTGLSLRLLLEGADEPGRGDTGGSSVPEQLRLTDVAVRGFQVRPRSGALPLELGAIGRFGSGGRAVDLPVDVVVTDCSVDVGAQRRITASLRRDDGPVGSIVVQGSPAVVRALDDLVRRSCRRPRG